MIEKLFQIVWIYKDLLLIKEFFLTLFNISQLYDATIKDCKEERPERTYRFRRRYFRENYHWFFFVQKMFSEYYNSIRFVFLIGKQNSFDLTMMNFIQKSVKFTGTNILARIRCQIQCSNFIKQNSLNYFSGSNHFLKNVLSFFIFYDNFLNEICN